MLAAHDWSWLDYKNTAKEDLIIRAKKNAKQIGFDLYSALLIHPDNGNPLISIVMNLQTIKEIYSYNKKFNTPPRVDKKM